MKILIVAATNNEVKELRDKLELIAKLNDNLYNYRLGMLDIDILVTGHGSVFMTYHLLKTFSIFNYDLAINAGIAGSFDYFLELGFVVNVVQDEFADLGFEDKDSFFTLSEKEMLKEDSFPFTGEVLRSIGTFELTEVDSLIPVKAFTVNTMHEKMENIQKLKSKFSCEIVTMEGAAFFYVCLMEKIPFLQIRAISYFVELRKVENWNFSLAIKNLSASVFDILMSLQ
ncbi:MAG: hypothetical protein JXB19_00610 [Bacteroidales bacterium]|nr:hypothetical protein [Bacteroidales bacterium]